MKIKKFNEILNESYFSDLKEKYLINRLKKSYKSFCDYADGVNNNIINLDLLELVNFLKKLLSNIDMLFNIKNISIEKKVELTDLYFNRSYNSLIFIEKNFKTIEGYISYDLKNLYFLINKYAKYFKKEQRKFIWYSKKSSNKNIENDNMKPKNHNGTYNYRDDNNEILPGDLPKEWKKGFKDKKNRDDIFLDKILDKISKFGEKSLTGEEIKLLNKYKNKK